METGGAFIELLDRGGNGLEAGIDEFLLLVKLLAGTVLEFLEFVAGQIKKLALVIGKGLT